eukprot:13510013-Alexandrium_andersonii.AAC.1
MCIRDSLLLRGQTPAHAGRPEGDGGPSDQHHGYPLGSAGSLLVAHGHCGDIELSGGGALPG